VGREERKCPHGAWVPGGWDVNTRSPIPGSYVWPMNFDWDNACDECQERAAAMVRHDDWVTRHEIDVGSGTASSMTEAELVQLPSEELAVEWKRRRNLGTERRREEVKHILKQPLFLPDWLDALLTECKEEFTDFQFEALLYRYGYELSLQEAADALGIKKQTFRKRLSQADAKVAHLRGDVLVANQRIEELVEEWDTSHVDVWTEGSPTSREASKEDHRT